MLDKLENVKLEHVFRSANKMLDKLVNLVATMALGANESITVLIYFPRIMTPPKDACEEVKLVSFYDINKED